MPKNAALQSNDLLNILKTSELFAHVPDEVLASMRDRMELSRLSAGMTLFTQRRQVYIGNRCG